ncbi:hypothetical protein B0H14DRAFT_2875486 [Mycena olivaceomarginata]|nr:hypothetical protein B0H14DRAFT_2875486 [Mycena olivaceomarginata]
MVADSHRTKCLPPELECMIFETAALAHPTSIPHLILVARWLKHRVEPLLYRVIFVIRPSNKASDWEMFDFPLFTIDILLRVIETKPPGFLQNSVRYLHIDAPIKHSDLQTIGAACSGVMNLFHYCTGIAMSPGVLSGLQNLRFLTISLREFLHCCSFTKVHSVLANITHLEFLETGHFRREVLAAHLPLLPRLTHLALDSILLDVPFRTALRANKTLQCIVCLVSVHYIARRVHPGNIHLLSEDSRLVCVDQETDWRADWLHGVATGENCWTTSEAFIAARRDGKANRSRYSIVDTDTSWGD